jgi:DNA-binding MarR family transcriptional regulator
MTTATSSRTDELIDLLQQTIVQLHPSLTELTKVCLDGNVTIQQLRVMTILSYEGPRPVSLLARRLSVATPTMTGILDRLVRQDLVARQDDPEDRRVVLNVLTEQGQDLIERFQPVQADRLREIVDQLNLSQRQEVASGLHSLLSAVQRLA